MVHQVVTWFHCEYFTSAKPGLSHNLLTQLQHLTANQQPTAIPQFRTTYYFIFRYTISSKLCFKAEERLQITVRVMQLWVNSGTTGVYGSQMEHWLQLMCCTLAVVLIPYFGEVRGRSRKREDKELLKLIFKLKCTVEYLRVYIQR